MRQLTSHRVEGSNEQIEIQVLDEPGHGNACHEYNIKCIEELRPGNTTTQHFPIRFQNGPLAEHGINGISNEALLAVVEDRLLGFQAGPYACRDNAVALTKIQEAMMWLHKRTRERIARGVEGTPEK